MYLSNPKIAITTDVTLINDTILLNTDVNKSYFLYLHIKINRKNIKEMLTANSNKSFKFICSIFFEKKMPNK
jgi:hypothetical protein